MVKHHRQRSEETLSAVVVLTTLEEVCEPGSGRFKDVATVKAASVAKYDEDDIKIKMRSLSMVYTRMVFPLL